MSEVGKTEEKRTFGEILKDLDSKVSKDGVKPSEALEFSKVVRAKYGLPDPVLCHLDPKRYIEQLEAVAKQNNIEIRPIHEFQPFFDELPEASAVAFGESVFRKPTVVVGQAREGDIQAQFRRGKSLAHELVHVLQELRYPRMPFAEQEKEAYYYQVVDELNILKFKDEPKKLDHLLNKHLDFLIKASSAVDRKI